MMSPGFSVLVLYQTVVPATPFKVSWAWTVGGTAWLGSIVKCVMKIGSVLAAMESYLSPIRCTPGL